MNIGIRQVEEHRENNQLETKTVDATAMMTWTWFGPRATGQTLARTESEESRLHRGADADLAFSISVGEQHCPWITLSRYRHRTRY
jgi:hypothetical protein